MKLFWSFWAILNLFHFQATENLAGNLNCQPEFRPECNKIPFLSHQGLVWHHFVTPKTCLNSSATEYEEETCDLACETNFHTIVVAAVWCATIFSGWNPTLHPKNHKEIRYPTIALHSTINMDLEISTILLFKIGTEWDMIRYQKGHSDLWDFWEPFF